jgi:hypothetical protein
MKTTKNVTITLKTTTIELLEAYSKATSVNKSALIDRLVNEEISKKGK